VLIANPIPASDELPAETYEQALETALSDAARQGCGAVASHRSCWSASGH
jgi:Uncharacterized enzyme involved in pigment biosynthesis